MKNNKGFTVVELICSFALTMVISVFLFEVLIEVKDIYAETTLKTNIQKRLAIISKNIKYTFQPHNNVISNPCNENSCTVNGRTIKINTNNVQIGLQTYQMPANVSIDVKSIINTPIGTDEGYITVRMTLTSPILSENYEYVVSFYYATN